MKVLFLLLFFIILVGTLAEKTAAQVRFGVVPATVLVESSAGRQLVSFDFRVENTGSDEVLIRRITVFAFDRSGRLQLRKFLEDGTFRHSDDGTIRLQPKTTAFFYNPFLDFAPEVDLSELKFEFALESRERKKESVETVTVRPKIFRGRTVLQIPLKGRVLVHDGHDLYAHHRRFNLESPFLKEIGVTKNFTRYGSDLVIVDEKGNMRRNESTKNEDWFGFGATLYAPAAGRVVRAKNQVEDNIDGKAAFTLDEFRRDPTTPGGNFIIIDHLNGEFSLLAHCKKGSVRVKEGDMVRGGQPIAQMGVSGDAYLPHLHYELRDSGGLDADGLPAYFHGFSWLLGSRRIRVARGTINSGDMLDVR